MLQAEHPVTPGAFRPRYSMSPAHDPHLPILFLTLQKAEPRSLSCSPGPAHPRSSRHFSSLYDFHGHMQARTEENVFSHLPLHSQHLARTPCPLIPIGGIQMVQARPGAQPTLLPGSSAAWVSGFSGGGSDLTGAREAQERGRWSPTESSSASVSPVAKVSKFTLSSELEGRDYPKETERTGGGLGRPPDWEPIESAPTHGSCSPRPPQGHQATQSWSSHLESSHKLANTEASATPALDRSSSMGCLAEAAARFPARRRNLSGEPRTRQGSPEPSGSGEPRASPPQPKDRDPLSS